MKMITILALISLSAFAYSSNEEQVLVKSSQTIENGDGTVTVYPYKVFRHATLCGYKLTSKFGLIKNKNKICRDLGYHSYVPDTLTINPEALLPLDARAHTILGCMGQPMGTNKGIKTIDCNI